MTPHRSLRTIYGVLCLTTLIICEFVAASVRAIPSQRDDSYPQGLPVQIAYIGAKPIRGSGNAQLVAHECRCHRQPIGRNPVTSAFHDVGIHLKPRAGQRLPRLIH